MGGHTDLLNLVLLNISIGKRSNVVTSADSINSFVNLKSDLERLAVAIYLAELINSLVPEEIPHIGVYRIFRQSLEELNKNQDPQIISRYLELKILSETGYAQELYNCVLCRSEILPNQHSYTPSLGGVICLSCPVNPSQSLPLSLNSLKVLRYFDRSELNHTLSINLDNQVQYELEKVLNQSISWIIEKQSKARKFVEHLQAMRENNSEASS